MEALLKISQLAEEIKQHLVSIDELVAERSDKLSRLDSSIGEKTSQLEALNAAVEQQRIASKEEVSKLQAETNEARSQRDRVLGELEESKKTLDATKKKHEQFVAYQLRAEKALSTREESILKREELLETTIAQSRRRKGILDDVT